MAFDTPADTGSADVPDNLDIPVLAIRNTVIFPVLAFPINVGRAPSRSAPLKRRSPPRKSTSASLPSAIPRRRSLTQAISTKWGRS